MILLAAAVYVLVTHIDLLTNAPLRTNVFLAGIVPATLLAAGVAAQKLKRRRPHVYAAIGGVHPEDGHISTAEPVEDAVTNGLHR